jgi:glutamate racemase
MKNNPIAFFDSGIGGSTILKEVMKSLPNEDYVYYPDSINNPYGNKSRSELFDIVDNIVAKLIIYKPKVIVCACNTATTMVLKDIREKYNDVVFIGTEPAIKVLFDKYSEKKSIVLTTKGTKDSERFKELCKMYKTNNCFLVEAPLLASLIERGDDVREYLSDLLKGFKDIEVVVLGCTHFPIVKGEIKEVLGDVLFVDGANGIANRIFNILDSSASLNKSGGSLEILTDDENIKKRIIGVLDL